MVAASVMVSRSSSVCCGSWWSSVSCLVVAVGGRGCGFWPFCHGPGDFTRSLETGLGRVARLGRSGASRSGGTAGCDGAAGRLLVVVGPTQYRWFRAEKWTPRRQFSCLARRGAPGWGRDSSLAGGRGSRTGQREMPGDLSGAARRGVRGTRAAASRADCLDCAATACSACQRFRSMSSRPGRRERMAGSRVSVSISPRTSSRAWRAPLGCVLIGRGLASVASGMSWGCRSRHGRVVPGCRW